MTLNSQTTVKTGIITSILLKSLKIIRLELYEKLLDRARKNKEEGLSNENNFKVKVKTEENFGREIVYWTFSLEL